MFTNSAQYYDEIYLSQGKKYSTEVVKIHSLIQKHKKSQGKLLLDVACGTGIHIGYFSRYYKVEGLDLDAKMLSVARKKHPKIRFTRGDMTDFDLGRQFDIVTCLFSSIGYVQTKAKLHRAIENMGRHILPGGLLLVEPWFTPKQWNPGSVFTQQVEKPDLKIIRMSLSKQKGKISLVEFQYLIGSPKKIEHLTEVHKLGLFTHEEYLNAFKAAGLSVIHKKNEPGNRGIYIGKKAVK